MQDCVTAHLAREFRLTCTVAGRQWTSGQCPSCGGRTCLSLAIQRGRSLLWECHRRPTAARPREACSYEAIIAAAAEKLPECIRIPRKPAPPAVPLTELEPLLSLPDCSMRLRLACLAWQMTPKDAAAKLGMSRRTYYRAVSGVPDVARKRRSA